MRAVLSLSETWIGLYVTIYVFQPRDVDCRLHFQASPALVRENAGKSSHLPQARRGVLDCVNAERLLPLL